MCATRPRETHRHEAEWECAARMSIVELVPCHSPLFCGSGAQWRKACPKLSDSSMQGRPAPAWISRRSSQTQVPAGAGWVVSFLKHLRQTSGVPTKFQTSTFNRAKWRCQGCSLGRQAATTASAEAPELCISCADGRAGFGLRHSDPLNLSVFVVSLALLLKEWEQPLPASLDPRLSPSVPALPPLPPPSAVRRPPLATSSSDANA
jgi:hypothetical protein